MVWITSVARFKITAPIYALLCCVLTISSPSLTYAKDTTKAQELENTVAEKEKPQVILVVGDSISAGFGIDKALGWVNLLDQALGEKGSLVNASISGDTSTGGRYRLGAALDAHQPDWVVIELGGNDGLRGTPIKLIRQNLVTMVKQSKAAGAEVMLLGMQIPPNYGDRYTSAFRDMYADIAKQEAIPLVPFLLDGVAGIADMMQADGIHPTAKAQPIMMQHVQNVLAEAGLK